MSGLEQPEQQGAGTVGTSPTDRDADVSGGGALVPPELFAPIMASLSHMRCKRTLLNFMLCSRLCYNFGLPLLLRDVAISARGGFDEARALAFASDFLATSKLRNVKRLVLSPFPARDVLRLLAGKLGRLDRLEIMAGDADFLRDVFDYMQRGLITTAVLKVYVVPSSARYFVRGSFPVVPKLELELEARIDEAGLARLCIALERACLQGLPEWDLCSSLPDGLDLSAFPLAVSKLRRATITSIRAIATFPAAYLRLRELEVWKVCEFRQVWDLVAAGTPESVILYEPSATALFRIPAGVGRGRRLRILKPVVDIGLDHLGVVARALSRAEFRSIDMAVDADPAASSYPTSVLSFWRELSKMVTPPGRLALRLLQ